MKFSPAQFLPQVQKGEIRAFLLYGSEVSLKKALLQEVFSYFSYQEVPLAQSAAYMDNLGRPSLFGDKGKQMTLITDIATPNQELIELMTQWPKDFWVAAQVNTCPPSILSHPSIGAVSCYECSLSDSRLIMKRFSSSLHFAPDAFEWAAQLAKNGQWQSLSTMLSLCGDQEITRDQISLFLEPQKEDEVWFLLKPMPIDTLLITQDPLRVCRSWQRLLSQMWQYKVYAQTMASDLALKKVSPFIFFKIAPFLSQRADLWSFEHLLTLLDKSFELEVQVKTKEDHVFSFFQDFLKIAHYS